MENLLDDIEKVVDDFCSGEKKEEENGWFAKDFEQTMLNKRLDIVLQKHQEEALERRQQKLEQELQYRSILERRMEEIQQKSFIGHNSEIRTDSIKCRCGRTIEVTCEIDRISVYPIEGKFERYQSAIEQIKYDCFYCGFCGEYWKMPGKIIAIKNY